MEEKDWKGRQTRNWVQKRRESDSILIIVIISLGDAVAFNPRPNDTR